MTEFHFPGIERFDDSEIGFWEYNRPIFLTALACVCLVIAGSAFDYWNSPVSVPGEYDLGGSRLSTQIAAEVTK
ncbi:hypothetical protein [uncultured Ruegeria sp.]|uniref:hypothetical protein n=1 Tax=uncultured Ruegeria sp. TaxID=259304 RepID=UPI002609A0CC|nr:hypothetical protein [uncultured Ruegeria sp.]